MVRKLTASRSSTKRQTTAAVVKRTGSATQANKTPRTTKQHAETNGVASASKVNPWKKYKGLHQHSELFDEVMKIVNDTRK